MASRPHVEIICLYNSRYLFIYFITIFSASIVSSEITRLTFQVWKKEEFVSEKGSIFNTYLEAKLDLTPKTAIPTFLTITKHLVRYLSNHTCLEKVSISISQSISCQLSSILAHTHLPSIIPLHTSNRFSKTLGNRRQSSTTTTLATLTTFATPGLSRSRFRRAFSSSTSRRFWSRRASVRNSWLFSKRQLNRRLGLCRGLGGEKKG